MPGCRCDGARRTAAGKRTGGQTHPRSGAGRLADGRGCLDQPMAVGLNRRHRRSAGLLLGCWGGIQQDIALDTDLLDQVELAIEEVDMLLLAFQDPQQQIA